MYEFNELLYKIAASPIGVAIKVGVWAAIGWLVVNIDTFEIHPMIAVAVTAAGVVLTDALNPEDARFGKNALK